MKSFARLLNYVKVNTTSDESSSTIPSTSIQMNLGKMLVDELIDLGITDAYMDKYGYVYGKINNNTTRNIQSIGFIAHLDTSPSCNGENVNPKMIFNYDGGDVVLNKELNIILSPNEYPFLNDLKNQTLITTDGTSLLGADDKAGIAEIMTMVEYFMTNKDIEHGDIYIAFTPDEEIGEGTRKFDLDFFKPDFAYTVDGGKEGSIEYENFNAASCEVKIKGINIHPGSAKGHMINSILIASEFNNMLPSFSIPQNTSMYEGFNHLDKINGDVEETTMNYIIRNHNKELFNKQKNDFYSIKDFINNKYQKELCTVSIKDSYYNMFELIKSRMDIIEIANEACKMENVIPITLPIRGGTDGASLTYKGLLCPNLGTGGYNFHGRYECITTEAMDKCTNILINIVKLINEGFLKK